MMSINYGVCPKEAAPHKGYSDFVQHTGPMVSGLLRVSLGDAQTLPVTFGYSQAWYNSFGVEQTLCADCIGTKIGRNSLMGHNYSESRELAKHEQYSGSEVPTKSTGSWRDGADLLHEKGRTANATLWDDCFFNHEENQHSPVLDDGRKPNLAYEENQYLAEPQDNHTEISGEVKPWHRSVLQRFRKTSTGATYKIFVGDRVTGSKPVQPSGSSLAFLLWRPFRYVPGLPLEKRFRLLATGSMSNRMGGLSGAGACLSVMAYSCSLAFLRCLRLISPCMAVTMNCPVVSPSSFTDSIASTTSCGARACTFCDFALTAFVATDEISLVWCRTVYTKNKPVKCLTCLHLENKVEDTLIDLRCENSEAQKDGDPIWASNHNVIGANTMACQHSTQTRPKFVFLFLGTPNEFPNTTPTVLRVEADTEDEGRAKFIGWTLVFAAQIRTEAPCRLQLFSTDEGFMWVYEQRQSATEVCHA